MKARRRKWWHISLLFILTATGGCAGGGTTGTGLGVLAGGVISDVDGSPLAGARVTASTASSDDQTISDAEGKYELEVRLEPGEGIEFRFELSARGINWRRTIKNVPQGTASLTVEWMVTPDNRVTPLAAIFFDADGNPIAVEDGFSP